jgi:hypothetical protein
MNKLHVVLFCIASINSTGCSQNTSLFSPSFSVNIPVGRNPSKVSVADLNKDSFNDLIITTSDGLSVLINDGKGNFTEAIGSPFPAGNDPGDIALADFNNDGNPDVALPNHERDEVTILFSDGNGIFRQASYHSLKIDFNPHAHSAAASDINKDGNIDLVLTNFLGSEIVIVFGDGKGNFSDKPKRISVPHYPYRNVIIDDINKDGNEDIITPANNSNSITVLLGNGRGYFSSAKYSPVGIGNNPFFVTTGDFNNDGYTDIAAGNFDEALITVLKGNKGNDFSRSVLKSFSIGQKPVCMATGDLNNDGILDLASTNYDGNNVSILMGDEKGMFKNKILDIPVGQSPYGLAIGDLNGDKKPDIITANFDSNNITILFNSKNN